MDGTVAVALGSYRTLLHLASGGMGAVYLARHGGAGGFERLVVIKRIHPHCVQNREFVAMFLDEARLATQIRHPNVVPVDNVVDSGGELFLVQPYIESVDFFRLLEAAARAGERLPPPLVARVLVDALAGLDGAHNAVDIRGHRLDLVHRDVSPQNLLVGTDGRSRLIDFGIAKAARRLTVTQNGVLKGKVSYMAPEQLRRQPVDARTDVFSAGVVLYEALTGQHPFDAEDEGATLLRVLLGEPAPPSSLAPGIPPAVDEVVARALSCEPDARFATAAEMQEALERAVPPAAPRDLAAAVERLCAGWLPQLRAQVQAELDGKAAPEAGGAHGAGRPLDAGGAPDAPRAPADPAHSPRAPADPAHSPRAPAGSSRSRRAPWWRAGAGAALLVALAGAGGLVRRASSAGEDRTVARDLHEVARDLPADEPRSSAAPPAAPPPAPPAAPPPAPPERSTAPVLSVVRSPPPGDSLRPAEAVASGASGTPLAPAGAPTVAVAPGSAATAGARPRRSAPALHVNPYANRR